MGPADGNFVVWKRTRGTLTIWRAKLQEAVVVLCSTNPHPSGMVVTEYRTWGNGGAPHAISGTNDGAAVGAPHVAFEPNVMLIRLVDLRF